MSYLILFIPFLINLYLLSFTNYWGFKGSFHLLFPLQFLFIGTFIILKKIQFIPKIHEYILFSLQLILFCILPIQNLEYGDGVILLQNLLMETLFFGFQLTIDEFWSALIHSYLFKIFHPNDPRIIYRVLSTLCGIIYLFISLKYSKKNHIPYLFFLTPGTILLFYGYIENYTIISLLLILTIILGINWIGTSNPKYIIYLAIIASISASFHLVYGYVLFGLIYFSYIVSQKNLKTMFQYGLISSIIAFLYLGGILIYFLFFHSVRIVPSDSHILSPPFYPIRRIISINHFKEILSVLWFTSLFPILIIIIAYLNNKEEFKKLHSNPKVVFNLWIVVGFFLHSLVLNPLLGFPSDWDLMSFYSYPLLFYSFHFLPLIQNYKNYIHLLAVYFILFQIITAFVLNKNPDYKETEYKLMHTTVYSYYEKYQNILEFIQPDSKKMYLKLHFFLYKSEYELNQYAEKNSQNNYGLYLEKIKNYQFQLNSHIKNNNGRFEKDFLKSYLKELTNFHYELILIRKENMKYHP